MQPPNQPEMGNNQTPPGDPAGDQSQQTWDAWLAVQPEAVRKMYEEQTAGLKSALDAERRRVKEVSAEQAKKLEAYEAEEKRRKEAEMSELQKAQARQAELEKQISQQAEALKTTRLRNAVEVTALKLGFQDPEDAYRLADLSEIELGEDGTVKGIEKALEALAKKRPYLIKTTRAPETDAGAGKKKTSANDAAIARRFGLKGS